MENLNSTNSIKLVGTCRVFLYILNRWELLGAVAAATWCSNSE